MCIFRDMSHWLGRLPLPYCWSSLAFPSRTRFKLLNSLPRIIERFYSFSVRHWLAATITRWWWPSVTFPVFQIHKNCCVKLLEYFFQELPIQTFIADFGSPSLPDFWLVLFLCLVDFPPFYSVMLLRVSCLSNIFTQLWYFFPVWD